MQRDVVYLLDILEAAKLAVSYLEGVAKKLTMTTTNHVFKGASNV